ncbi:uncharacterized protein PHACADRAFT_214539 [Phanerochaete carnosa HHB-10118-sp]|uniref:Nitrogen regulatory protein areA GATA-like domain-containing protein n=1 Tax=Phanerochaete carnosa (strain HHB-10118-sp) TaxID=650164 RepID=K5UHM2_PHACS|nr:uncharacterized protein PHACADRAFT_214539 [Phanerochaete carnosa HHB-10118-sp]EKM49016.1 hypothetical protein PHACADRAFT_214539 [Phanerochaete carnosa HHB-10118-sp]
MMPVPATLNSYLPVLLNSVTNHPLPDDSSYSIQAEGQVDYLSHEWREEDVWRSWRSMTRQKNAIANGMRLENASWRTWWKQRNKLKTISPETLNWLKDSDVTWLYGPLHIGSDWSKPPHQEPPPSPNAHRQNSLDCVGQSRAATPSGKKPILKRRSISQLLSLPQSPFFSQDGGEDTDEEDGHHGSDDEETSRPPLLHTKSDTHISWRSRPFRKNSPPRIIAPDHSPTDSYFPNASGTNSSDTSNTTGSSQDLSVASTSGAEGSGHGKKKHISFNTFVEQYIAIEKPDKRKGEHFYTDPVYDDGYDEESERGEEEESDDSTPFFMEEASALMSDSEDEDEDDVLEMRSSRSRSSSSSSRSIPSAMRTTSPPSAGSSHRPPLVRQSSTDRDRMTIAPIAPAMLKSTGVGNQTVAIGEDRLMPQKEVELVYVPPSNSIYSHPGTPNMAAEDVFHHRESYFSVGTDRSPIQSRSADSSPITVSFSLPHSSRQSSQSNLQQFFVHQQPVYESPMHADDIREEDAYDYFGGSDFGEEYIIRRSQGSGMRHNSSDMRTDDPGGQGQTRYTQSGVTSTSAGRINDRWSSPISASPRIVVNEVAGAEEEREELTTSSDSPRETTRELLIPRKSDTRIEDDIPLAVSYIDQGSAVPVPVPKIATQSTSNASPERGFLSPSEASVPTRGRSPGCSPVSGSTTTGSYSYSSDSRSESRGRSSTRNSSYSDRERSSSKGTHSPIGSISPTGSAVGVGVGYAAGRGRDSKTSARMYRRDEERGRDRTGRKIGDSLSPPSIISSPSRSISDDFPPYSPLLEKSDISASTGSVSGSSVSGSSTASVATEATIAPPKAGGQESEPQGHRGKFNSYKPSHIPIPSPIPEEEETRSRQPTPANSPVRAFSSSAHTSSPTPGSPLTATPSPKSRPSAPVTSPSEAQATPSSPTLPVSQSRIRSPERDKRGDGQEHGTLVGRAAEIVSSARGLLGAIWNAV